jgi:hypothetical protein
VRTLVILGVVVVLLVAACSDDGAGTLDPPAGDVVLRVVVDNAVARDWTLGDLEAEVPFAETVVEGDKQTGPLVVDVIAASGVEGWEKAEVLGMSEGRVIEVTLDIDAATIDDTWILDVTNRGTLKLAAPDLPRQQWVRDVGEIRFP